MKRACVAVAAVLIVLVACRSSTQDRSSSPRPGLSPDSPTAPPPSSDIPTDPPPPSDIMFSVRERYRAGQRMLVRIENVGDTAYRYQTIYAACFLTYRDEEGRRFIIPPGTHCDLLTTATLRPGERTTLFKWDLDECTKDEWGCSRARPLEPGTYRISGTFKPVDDGPVAHAIATFSITSA